MMKAIWKAALLLCLQHTTVVLCKEKMDDASAAAEMFDIFDQNKDGKVTWKELMVTAEGQELEEWKTGFKKADANNDKKLTVKELTRLLEYVNNPDKSEL
mmetsp:Transcript_52072/g.97754  ORF Transcript_52072/g.97754 Transcript_52072/m.97754 type:complete len:100 (-) Transcript_52072:114-413(-)